MYVSILLCILKPYILESGQIIKKCDLVLRILLVMQIFSASVVGMGFME